MLTFLFITFIYTTFLRNRDIKILQATAQRWMIKGHGGISYKITFTPRKHKKKLYIDMVWIHNKSYRATVTEQLDVSEKEKEYSENILSIDLTEGQPAPAETNHPLPAEIPVAKGDAVIVYTIGNKKRFHIIHQLQQLPFLIAN